MQPCSTLAPTLLIWKSIAEITYFLMILPIYPSTLVAYLLIETTVAKQELEKQVKGGRKHWMKREITNATAQTHKKKTKAEKEDCFPTLGSN